jgi:hypothetical protein
MLKWLGLAGLIMDKCGVQCNVQLLLLTQLQPYLHLL